jgi:tRNA(adenine34) deaminase
MCAGALFWSQIGKVVFAARDENRGATRIKPSIFHPKTLVTGRVLEQEAKELLQRFFQEKRN